MATRHNVLSALFESKSTYLMRQVSAKNAAMGFPIRNQISAEAFAVACRDNSVLLSGGGDAERAELIYELIRGGDGFPVFILSTGNAWLTEHSLCRRGYDAYRLQTVSGRGMSGKRQMAVLSSLDPDLTLGAFWQFAFEVCRAMAMPAAVETVASIDWQEMDWQMQLIQTAPSDVAEDLIMRFDQDMAKSAVKASVLMEKLMRSAITEQDSSAVGIYDALRSSGVYCASVPSSSSAVTQQLLEAFQDAMERGNPFTLILDNVYLKDLPLIRDRNPNVRMILSSNDLCASVPDLSRLTQRRCGVALFRHDLGGSADKLSAHFFGMFERRYAENSITTHRNQFSLFSSGVSSATSIRTGRDYRLNPEWLCTLPQGTAFVRAPSGGEGIMCFNNQDSNMTRKRLRR